MDFFTQTFAELPDYARLLDALDTGEVPVCVTGLSAVHKAQLALTLAGRNVPPLLILTGTEVVFLCLGGMPLFEVALVRDGDRIDIDTGVYNRKALQNDLSTYIVNKRPVGVICIKITNLELLERTGSFDSSDILTTVVAAFLRTMVPRYCIYSTSPGTFILTETTGSEERAGKIAHIVSRRFDRPWHFGDTELLLNAVVMTSQAPERIKSAGDAFYMADCPIPADLDKKILSGRDLDYLMRRAAVDAALSDDAEAGVYGKRALKGGVSVR